MIKAAFGVVLLLAAAASFAGTAAGRVRSRYADRSRSTTPATATPCTSASSADRQLGAGPLQHQSVCRQHRPVGNANALGRIPVSARAFASTAPARDSLLPLLPQRSVAAARPRRRAWPAAWMTSTPCLGRRRGGRRVQGVRKPALCQWARKPRQSKRRPVCACRTCAEHSLRCASPSRQPGLSSARDAGILLRMNVPQRRSSLVTYALLPSLL